MLNVSSARVALPLALVVLLPVTAAVAEAQAATQAAQRLDAENMKAALRTAAPEDDGFIDRVLKLVDEGKLSPGVVQSTFAWARQQPQHKFQHFKRGLILRVDNPTVRTELLTGESPAPDTTPTLGETIVSRVKRLFSLLPSIHTRILR